MIFDSVENVEDYCFKGDPLDRAIEFVCGIAATLPDGEYEIDKGLVANVQSVRTVAAEEKVFEAHKKYIDVQMVLEGCERQDVALLEGEKIEVVQEYDEAKDVMLFKAPEHFSTIVLKPDMFVVYCPGDGHRPCCSVGGPENIRKVCVKMKI